MRRSALEFVGLLIELADFFSFNRLGIEIGYADRSVLILIF
jgi:hypothetical protein